MIPPLASILSRLHFKQLRLLIALADCGSLLRAAAGKFRGRLRKMLACALLQIGSGGSFDDCAEGNSD